MRGGEIRVSLVAVLADVETFDLLLGRHADAHGRLPPYEVLDAILQRYMENDQGVEDVIAAGFDRALVERVARLIRVNEYKRRQAPLGIRVTHRSFGKDWRYPITGKFSA